MAEEYTPVDLISAGGAAPPANPQSMQDAMRGGGSPPAGLMAALQPPTMTPASQAAYAAVAGLNPTGVNPLDRQMNVQHEIQMQQAQLIQRAVEHQQKMAYDKASHLIPIYNSFLKSDSPEARLVGARGMEGVLKSQGMQMPAGFAESFKDKLPSMDTRKEAYMAVLAAKGNPALQAGLDQYLTDKIKIPKDMLQMVKQEAGSDMVHKLFYGTTPQQEQLAIQKADLEQTKFDLQMRKQDAAEAAQASRDTAMNKRLDIQSGHLAVANANQALAQQRMDLAEKKFEYAQAKGPEEKRMKALDQAQLLTDQMDAASQQLDKNGFLPKNGMSKLDPRYALVVGKRATDTSDQAWQLWVKHLQPAMIGYARNVQGDIGPRAIAAFQGALQLMENPPDLKSIQEVVRNMRLAVKMSRDGTDTASSVYIKQGATGNIIKVPWKRGMEYAPGDTVVKVE